MVGKLYVFEASDGCGKKTQSDLFLKYLTSKNIKSRLFSFPDYNSPSSYLVKEYLSGQISTNVYTASLFYLINRIDVFEREIKEFYLNGGVVILDRYTTSNALHQSSKLETENEKAKFLDWLADIEFTKSGLPKPDRVFCLKMSLEHSLENIKKRKDNKHKSIKDIHEEDIEYLNKTIENINFVSKYWNWDIIECMENNKLKSIEQIHFEIVGLFEKSL